MHGFVGQQPPRNDLGLELVLDRGRAVHHVPNEAPAVNAGTGSTVVLPAPALAGGHRHR